MLLHPLSAYILLYFLQSLDIGKYCNWRISTRASASLPARKKAVSCAMYGTQCSQRKKKESINLRQHPRSILDTYSVLHTVLQYSVLVVPTFPYSLPD